VGAGVAIFASNKPTARQKFKLDHRCSNNQVEQLAILKALELINHLEIADNAPGTIGVYTDSRITIDSLNDASNHNYLIEVVRKKLTNLRRTNWTIEFSWIKSHAGNPGKELADHLAKDAASNNNTPVVFDRIPKTTLYKELEDETIQKWQEQWDRCNKAAVTKRTGQDKPYNKYKTEIHGTGNWPWKNPVLPTQVQHIGNSNMPLQYGGPNSTSYTLQLHMP